MNKISSYNSEYFVDNPLRLKHVNSSLGFFIRLYYKYLALYCIVNPANICKTDKILDVGCSIGILVQQFNELGYQAIGVDVNKAAIENSLCPENCFLVKTTSHLNYPDNYFDLIFSRGS